MGGPALTTLDAFADGDPDPPRERSPGGVTEVDAASALTDCGLPKTPYSLNPYEGCSHGCRYCYVPSVTHEDQATWGGWVRVKRNLPRLLSREVRRRDPGLVFLSSATDPYQPVEGRYRVTRYCLEVLERVDWPLRILTRSPLLRRDLEVLEGFSQAWVGLSIPTLDDGFRAVLEPEAPPVDGRLRALRAADEAGLDTYVSMAPTYPLTDGWTPEAAARAVAEAGAQRVFFGAWRYEDKAEPAVRRRLQGTRYETHASSLFDDEAARTRIARLRDAFAAHGVELDGPPRSAG
jgi:DNA repair photolyase